MEKAMSRVGEREVIDAIEQPFQTCHRFCTDRQCTLWWVVVVFVCLGTAGVYFLTDVRQDLESSAAREVAPRLSFELVPQI
ncbi:hypothetical protein IVA95_19335 [Bradyrhizobium sp. 157]|uniref:hypothetical protein n=1 Tax=Bradyrhizobium sp. 157 TaxID=2782631 RepID=UPI001FFBBBD7|nr:hypothetical protein [Bradyrhizobium sp. 157]MCK1639683.1 hypothetical protein [Bradyrhizobium sp. 157]